MTRSRRPGRFSHRRRALLCLILLPLIGGCSGGSGSSDSTVAETPTETTAVAPPEDTTAATADTTPTDTTPAETTPAETEVTESTAQVEPVTTPPPETTAVEPVARSSVELTTPAVFEIVTAFVGRWPNAVPAAAMTIADVDSKKLCATLLDGGAFPGASGEYYEAKLTRLSDQLDFTCKYRRTTPPPESLDGFADAFVSALATGDDSGSGPDMVSLGRVTLSLMEDPLSDAADPFPPASAGCAAAATAVGLPPGWTVETVGSRNGKRQVICRGPLETPEVIKADTAAVQSVVGQAAPPAR